MTPPDLQKLLGGYAAGTLTPEEQRALFDAALADQTLFDALADEQALREVLADPACRERVQAALVERPRTAFWLWRPAAWTLAAATAVAAVVLTVVVLRTKSTPGTPQQIAMANKPAAPEIAPSTPAPERAPKLHAADRITRHAPAAAGKPMPRMAALPAAPPPPAAPAPQSVASPFSPPGMGAARKFESPRPGALGGVAVAPPAARAAQLAQDAETAPPPPPATNENVTVVAASPMIVTQAEAQNKPTESKGISNLPITGRDAAELMKLMPGAFGLRYTLLRRGEGDKDAEVPPDTRFGRHESVHLRIEAAQGGYLYVLAGKRALYAGAVTANQPVLITTRPGLLRAALLPQPDSGPLSTLVSRARQQQLEAARFQRSDATRLGSGQPAPILLDISIKSR